MSGSEAKALPFFWCINLYEIFTLYTKHIGTITDKIYRVGIEYAIFTYIYISFLIQTSEVSRDL